MSYMKLAKYTFAVGGAGKELIYAMFGVEEIDRKIVINPRKEWIIKELIRPKNIRSDVFIKIVDTAIDEANGDMDRVRAINAKISQLQNEVMKEVSDPDLRVGNVSVTFQLLTDKMVLNNPHAIIGIGDQVKKAVHGTEVWWMNDPKLGEDWHKRVMDHENLRQMDFAKGVYRKRAIGKAIYYKALSNNSFNPNVPSNDEVDIIIGIGGGTGSGIAIDLAKTIKETQQTANITLFGILSTLNEQTEKANSFAMLSELEHSCLHKDKNLFKNIILVPMEKTRFPGRVAALFKEEMLLKEFDDTFPHILISYHNAGTGGLLFNGLPEHAPFVIATSQIVRYNVEAIRRFKEKLVKVLQGKEKSLENEKNIYGTIRNIVGEFYSDSVETILTDTDRSNVKNRFTTFTTILEDENFQKFNYNSIQELKNAVDAGMSANKENVEDQISEVGSQVEATTVTHFKDTTDSMLYNISKKDIEMIEELIYILSSINKIQDRTTRDTLNAVARANRSDIGRGQYQIKEEIKVLTKTNKETADKIVKWRSAVDKVLQLLDLLDKTKDSAGSLQTKLHSDIEEFVSKVNSAKNRKTVESIQNTGIKETLDKYDELLKNIGMEFTDRNAIMRAVDDIKQAKIDIIEHGKLTGVLGRIGGIINGRRSPEAIKENIHRLVTELEGYKVFSLVEGTVYNIYKSDIEQLIIRKRDDMVNVVLKHTRESFPSILSLSELENILKSPEKRKEMKIENIINPNLSENLRKLETISDRVSSLMTIVNDYSVNIQEYDDYVKNIDQHVDNVVFKRDDAIYVTDIQPKDIFGITTDNNADIRSVLRDSNEINSLKNNVDKAIDRAVDPEYNVLQQNVVITSDGRKKWEDTRVVSSFSTIANVGRTAPVLDPGMWGQKVRNAFSIDQSHIGNYSDWVCPWGDAWEVGITLFIVAVPFDNIRNIVDSGQGYYQDYRKCKSVFFHHAYMIEKGKLVKRNKVFDLRKDEDKMKLLDKGTVQQLYHDNYEEVEIQTCL